MASQHDVVVVNCHRRTFYTHRPPQLDQHGRLLHVKQIDLGPDDYKKLGPDGRWQLPNHPLLAMVGFFVSVAILVLLYVTRDQISPDNLFGATAILAFCAGILLAQWLRDVY